MNNNPTKETSKAQGRINTTNNFQNSDSHHSSLNVMSTSRQPFLFSLKDHKPGQISKSLKYCINIIKSRLNYEFGDSEDTIESKLASKRVPKFVSSKANIMDIVGNIRVGQNVPVESSRQILIATTWRSGSSFLGDLLNHYKGTFYYFEPLHFHWAIKDLKPAQSETRFMKSLFTCKFNSENVGFLKHVSESSNKFLFENHNFRLWNSCHNLLPNNAMCFMPDYLNHACRLFPIKLIKTVRLRGNQYDKVVKRRSECRLYKLTGGQADGQAGRRTGSARY